MQLKLCLLVLVIFIGSCLCAEFLTITFMKYAGYVEFACADYCTCLSFAFICALDC